MRGRVLAVTGLGGMVGMLLWGIGGADSLTGAKAAFIFVFLSVIVLLAVHEMCGRCHRRRGWRCR